MQSSWELESCAKSVQARLWGSLPTKPPYHCRAMISPNPYETENGTFWEVISEQPLSFPHADVCVHRFSFLASFPSTNWFIPNFSRHSLGICRPLQPQKWRCWLQIFTSLSILQAQSPSLIPNSAAHQLLWLSSLYTLIPKGLSDCGGTLYLPPSCGPFSTLILTYSYS